MDIFDILKAISKKKMAFINADLSEEKALIKAEFEISKEYHIPLSDIQKLLGVRLIPI
jgi:hypothetical protein